MPYICRTDTAFTQDTSQPHPRPSLVTLPIPHIWGIDPNEVGSRMHGRTHLSRPKRREHVHRPKQGALPVVRRGCGMVEISKVRDAQNNPYHAKVHHFYMPKTPNIMRWLNGGPEICPKTYHSHTHTRSCPCSRSKRRNFAFSRRITRHCCASQLASALLVSASTSARVILAWVSSSSAL